MTHYYCFVESAGNITPDTRIFKVKVGDCRRDQIKRALLENYAEDTGAFFRVWDGDTDYFLSRALSLKPDSGRETWLGSLTVSTDICTLYRHILDGTLSDLRRPPFAVRNFLRMSSILSPSFFFKNRPRRKAESVPTVPRKNLSVRPTDDEIHAALCFAAIVLLYWLGSLIGCWERAVL